MIIFEYEKLKRKHQVEQYLWHSLFSSLGHQNKSKIKSTASSSIQSFLRVLSNLWSGTAITSLQPDTKGLPDLCLQSGLSSQSESKSSTSNQILYRSLCGILAALKKQQQQKHHKTTSPYIFLWKNNGQTRGFYIFFRVLCTPCTRSFLHTLWNTFNFLCMELLSRIEDTRPLALC